MSASAQPGAKDPVAVYIAALSGSHWKTRWQAAQALGELDDSRAIQPLIKALEDSNQWVRIVAAEALGQIGSEDGTDALLDALNDENIWLRRASIVALGQIGDSRAIQPLLRRILDPPDNEWPEELRDAIAKALGNIGGLATKALIDALENPDAWVSSSAARALGRIGDPEAIIPLTGLTKQGHSWARSAATQALAQITDARAVRAALATDEAPRAFWKLMALREIDESTVNQLTAMLEDPDEHIASQAAEVLSQLGNGRDGDPLVAIMRAKSGASSASNASATPAEATIRLPSQAALSQGQLPVNASESISLLVDTLADPVAEVRLAAAEALGKAGDTSVIPALSQALQDKDSHVRAAAARSLGELARRRYG